MDRRPEPGMPVRGSPGLELAAAGNRPLKQLGQDTHSPDSPVRPLKWLARDSHSTDSLVQPVEQRRQDIR
jgi:hypothetical protein